MLASTIRDRISTRKCHTGFTLRSSGFQIAPIGLQHTGQQTAGDDHRQHQAIENTSAETVETTIATATSMQAISILAWIGLCVAAWMLLTRSRNSDDDPSPIVGVQRNGRTYYVRKD